MKRYLTSLSALPSLWFWLVSTGLCAGEPQIKVEQVLQTTQSWDSSPYTSYPSGQPQVTVLKITIPPNQRSQRLDRLGCELALHPSATDRA
jgi:hypothetical protein